MASAHDTVSDGSVIGAEFDDSGDFVDQNQTVICRPDCSLPATTIPQDTTSRSFI